MLSGAFHFLALALKVKEMLEGADRGLTAIPNQKTLNIASIGFQYSLPSYRLHH
jgi:hypothetical protein